MSIDVVIIGAGVAGTTCAAALAGKGKRVVIFDHDPCGNDQPPRHDWVTRSALDILDELKVNRRSCIGEPFSGATFHSADLSKSMESKAAEPPAFRVIDNDLVKRLTDRARALGVEIINEPCNSEVTEHGVRVSVAGRDVIEAKLRVFAASISGAALHDLEDQPRFIEQVLVPVKKRSSDHQLHWVLGLDGGSSLAAWWLDGSKWIFHYDAYGAPDEVEGRVTRFLDKLAGQGLPPNSGNRRISRERFVAPPHCALEIDSHVDKRTLWIGDAGGFFAACSRERIYPAMWSARLAADILARALESDRPQDELRQFSSLWRTTMGEYLRVPNTDAHFLLPLVFSNQQMTERMANAFWHGENI